LILKLLYALELLRRQEFFFFLSSVIDFNKRLITMFETKRRKYYENIIIEVRVDGVTTMSQ